VKPGAAQPAVTGRVGPAPAGGPSRRDRLAVWWQAARPRTLPAGAAPVMLGTALAFSHDAARPLAAALALATALLLQVGANLANDVLDFERGADTAGRLGPPRAVQQGLVSARAMRRATAAVLAAAALSGAGLVALGGWPLALLGLCCIAAALAYTGGPFPLAYHGLGDAAVFLFFGPVAVGGTYWVQAQALPPGVLAASVPCGLLAASILVVNNLRDVESDARVGKRTLAVRLGPGIMRLLSAALWLGAAGWTLALVVAGALPAAALGAAAVTFPVARRVRAVLRGLAGPPLNAVLADTARLQALAIALLALGVALGGGGASS